MKLLPLILFTFFQSSTRADVRLPALAGDHMVLQRDIAIPVWGWAEKGENISVKFLNQQYSTTADANGYWKVSIHPVPAGGPYQMLVSGPDNTITLKDILIGDVWVCSGQSNMEFKVAELNAPEKVIAAANYPSIRLFTIPQQMAKEPLTDIIGGEWQSCSAETVSEFSAVAYFFGRALQKNIKIPIGLIHSSWGGTMIETWISASALGKVEGFAPVIQQLPSFDLDRQILESESAMKEWRDEFLSRDKGMEGTKPLWSDPLMNDKEWQEIDVPGFWDFLGFEMLDGVVWFRTEFNLSDDQAKKSTMLHLGPIDDNDITWVNGHKAGTIDDKRKSRSYALNPGMLRAGRNSLVVRVVDFGGRGGIFGRPEQIYVGNGAYKIPLAGKWKFKTGTENLPPIPRRVGPNSKPTLLFNAMISPVCSYAIKGVIWYQGEGNVRRAFQYRELFPLLITDWRHQWKQGEFPFLFVQLANFKPADIQPQQSEWAELREAQLMTLNLPGTGMAVTIDIGEENDIHPRNKLDVGKRLALAARRVAYLQNVVCSGPLYDTMMVDGDKINISFKNTGSGLAIKGKGPLRAWAIAGEDRRFVWADATIKGNEIDVWSSKVPNPVAVRYAWADNPQGANLYNKEGLPASPFRTDDWPGITSKPQK